MSFLTAPEQVRTLPIAAPRRGIQGRQNASSPRWEVLRFRAVRAQSEALAAPLTPEDQCIQSMADASPAKWHLAHTTWFFETMVLRPFVAHYACFDPAFSGLFNSYYESLGAPHPRPQRGLLSRPSCADVARYRAHVDACIESFAADADRTTWEKAAPLLMLGCHHEQQHQELLLTDILHAFSLNPTFPVYRAGTRAASSAAGKHRWISYDGGLQKIGHDGEGFAFDNEGPAHDVYVAPFCMASHPVTNGEWLIFMADGGYRRPELWLSDGWAEVQKNVWTAPLYWIDGDTWSRFTLGGIVPLDPTAPVCHVSYYEADAFARWCGKRLPTEQEWETVAGGSLIDGNFLESEALEPQATEQPQMFGNVWQWTQSPYVPYPRFKPAAGAVGAYNGKFMVNQMVLRGGSCVTPSEHIRPTYRNFFYPHMRWQFTGVRLAADT